MAAKKGKAKPASPRQKYSLRLTRKGVWFWIVSICFISVWMFVLGILVGRGTAPVRFDIHQLQKELAELREKTLKEELHWFKIDKDVLEDKSNLAFYEELKTDKEDISLPAEPIQEKRTPPTPKPPQKKTSPAAHKADPKPEKPESSGSGPKKSSTPQTPTKARLSVQVASVKDQKEADKIVLRLKENGFRAYRILAKVPGKGIWFRIRVGPYKNRVEANRALQRLKKEKYNGFLVNY